MNTPAATKPQHASTMSPTGEPSKPHYVVDLGPVFAGAVGGRKKRKYMKKKKTMKRKSMKKKKTMKRKSMKRKSMKKRR
jgi:hypothetical protein